MVHVSVSSRRFVRLGKSFLWIDLSSPARHFPTLKYVILDHIASNYSHIVNNIGIGLQIVVHVSVSSRRFLGGSERDSYG